MKKFIRTFSLLLVFVSVSCGQNLPELTRPTNAETPSPTAGISESAPSVSDGEASSSQGAGGERIQLTIYSSKTQEAFSYMIKGFADAHPEIKIKTSYFSSADINEQLNTRFMAGMDVPNVIYTSLIRACKYLAFRNGNFSDLYEFMNNDPDFDYDNYYTNVYKSFEDEGKLYAFPMGFQYTYAAVNNKLPEPAVSDFVNRDHVSYFDMIKAYNSISGQTDKQFEIWGDTWRPLLYLSFASYSQFVDFDNKTCDFLNDKFINLLNEYKKAFEPDEQFIGSVSGSYGGGILYEDDTKASLLRSFTMDGITDQYRFQYFFSYDKSNFIRAIPVTDEDGMPVILSVDVALIPALAEDKSAAWEFVKYMADGASKDPFAFQLMYGSCVPINKALFEDVFYSRMATFLNNGSYTAYPFTPVDFNNLPPGVTYGSGFNGDEETEVRRVFDEMSAWNGADISPAPYYECMVIIENVIWPFMRGEETAEQAAGELQNKITLLLNE